MIPPRLSGDSTYMNWIPFVIGAVTLEANNPLDTGKSLAVRLGDWIGWLSLAGLVFFTIFMPVTMRQTGRL